MSQKAILASEITENSKKNPRVESGIHLNAQVPHTLLYKPETLELFFPVYPDVRFACTHCGSLEVFLKTESVNLVRDRCLDCKTEWIETNHK